MMALYRGNGGEAAMLHSYRFSNHYSFREPTEVSFVLDGKAPDNNLSFVSPLGYRLSKTLAVFGANGSGKTNLLKPLAFLSWFLRESFRAPASAPIPIHRHFFADDQAAEFDVVFEALDAVWRYELKVTPERVLHEALYKKTARFSYVFTREWREAEQDYAIRQQGFGFNPVEARRVGGKVSLVSAALQYQVELAQKLMDSQPLQTNVYALGRAFMGHDHVLDAAQRYGSDQSMTLRMSELLHAWDLGLSSVELRKQKLRDSQNQEQDAFLPWGIHSAQGKKAELPFALESSGTQSAFVLLSRLLPILHSGGVAVIDELDNDLHPEMLTPVLDLFFSPHTNPENAQLIFTCHASPILNQFDKGQIMLVEKDEDCESHAYRLDSVKGVRADDNYYAKYMAGAYGAVPRV
jgi:predicted ATP-dependent endonuclease of OLD family